MDLQVDTRVFSKEGRNNIKEEYKTASKIGNTIKQIVTLKDVGAKDFFKQTNQNVKIYEAANELLKQDPNLAKQLQNKNLSPKEEREYKLKLVRAIEKN